MCMYADHSAIEQTRAQIEAAETEIRTYGKEKKQAFKSIRQMPEELPDFVQEWAKKSMGKWMFYMKVKRGSYIAVCEACGKKVHLTRARSSRVIECPACGAVVTLKDGTKTGGVGTSKACAYVERDGDAFTQRLFECYKSFYFNWLGIANK